MMQAGPRPEWLNPDAHLSGFNHLRRRRRQRLADHISAYRALSMAAKRAAFSFRRRRSLGFS
jgi:hypothetical protein